MRIVHLIWAFPIGGAETMLVDIMNEQVKSNSVSLVIINKKYDNNLISQINNKVSIIKLNRIEGTFTPFLLMYLNWVLFHKKLDALHCHNYTLSKLIIKPFLKKTILTVHGFNRPLTQNNKFKQIVAISNAVKIDLKKKGVKNVKVIENGVLSSKIKQKEKFNDVIQIVCIGRLIHEIKGQDILLKAFAKLCKNRNDIQLNFIGDGPSLNYLNKLSSKLNIKEKVIFHGLKSRNELYKILKNFDIVVQPSFHEGFGLAAVEAMVAKLPLLISSASGLLEVTNNGDLATVSLSNDYKEYESHLKKIIYKIIKKDFELKQQLESARIFAIDSFSINNTCQKYIKTYNQLLESTSYYK